MTTCKTCRWSFKVLDHQRYPVLMCWPGGDRNREQIVPKVACAQFQPIPNGAWDA